MEIVRDVRADCLVANRRRLDHRPRQGDRAAHRPAANRAADQLRRLRDDAGRQPDQRRDQDHAVEPENSPEIVIYDVDLTMTMPPKLSATSGINAIAHGRGALRARPQPRDIADGAGGYPHAGACAADHLRPARTAARTDALYGAWLSGICLGAVGMALHHKLCHTLGGSFNLPHAETHTVILPHALAYNAPAAPDAMTRIATALGVPDAALGLHDLARACGAGIAARDRHARERHRPGRRPRREEPVLESARIERGPFAN